MVDNIHPASGHGQITQGIIPNTLVEQTVEFVRNELPRWRDHSDRPLESSEERLNSQLCDFLDTQARQDFPMVRFHHEQKQTRDRRVDLAAKLIEGGFIGTAYHSIYDPFLVFEGKRLPAPNKDREREYVRGSTKATGGIQRFKLGLHGAKFEVAVMIGYVQDGTPILWHDRINSWICQLTAGPPLDGEAWDIQEQLTDLVDDVTAKTARLNSVHPREGDGVSASIRLYHLWIVMTVK